MSDSCMHKILNGISTPWCTFKRNKEISYITIKNREEGTILKNQRVIVNLVDYFSLSLVTSSSILTKSSIILIKLLIQAIVLQNLTIRQKKKSGKWLSGKWIFRRNGQGCPTSGTRARFGPPSHFIRPAKGLENVWNSGPWSFIHDAISRISLWFVSNNMKIFSLNIDQCILSEKWMPDSF